MKVGENLLDHHRVFDAGDDPDRAAAGLTDLDVNIEPPLEPLRPAHRGAEFGGRLDLRLIGQLSLCAFAPFRRGHPRTVFAVGRKHPVETYQVDPRLGHQSRQPGNEVQRLDKIAGSDFEQPKAGPKGEEQGARSNMTCVVPSRYGVFSS